MLLVGMLFGVLVAGPLLVLGALALANSDRAMTWLGRVRRRGLPASYRTTPGKTERGAGQVEAADAAAPADATSPR